MTWLTTNERAALAFIAERLNETGVAPSVSEMMDYFGYKSRGGIHRILVSLELKGFIKRLRYRARGIEVLQLPPEARPEKKTVQDQHLTMIAAMSARAPKPLRRVYLDNLKFPSPAPRTRTGEAPGDIGVVPACTAGGSHSSRSR